MAGDSKEDLDVVIGRLRKRYAATEAPKCCVCDGDMRLGMAGQGRIEWYCDSDEANSIGKKGQVEKDATKHYWASQHIQIKFGDEDVIRVLDELYKWREA